MPQDQEKSERTDPVIDWMKTLGMPITRENYIALITMGDPPEEWIAFEDPRLVKQQMCRVLFE